MEPAERPEVEVVCGVITGECGWYLACRRPEGKHLGGLWEFPGGKVDPGEAPEEALARELAEELGIRVEVGEALREVSWNYPEVLIRLKPFFCRVMSGIPSPIEHSEVRWVEIHALRGLDWAPADVPILEELIFREFPRKEV